MARAKFAKRHLFKYVRRFTHQNDSINGPMDAWVSFHTVHGHFVDFESAANMVWLIDGVRDTLVSSMRTCFAVKVSTAALQKKSQQELIEQEQQARSNQVALQPPLTAAESKPPNIVPNHTGKDWEEHEFSNPLAKNSH